MTTNIATVVAGMPRDTNGFLDSNTMTDIGGGGGGQHEHADDRTDSEDEGFDVNDTVVINVGGQRHETFSSTLKMVMGSKLSRLSELHRHYRADRGEYFFDRHAGVFAAVLNYCRTGELHLPTDLCAPLIKRELEYWEIDEDDIQGCCWLNYCAAQDKTRNISKFDTENDRLHNSHIQADEEDDSKVMRWRRKLWMLIDDPRSSRGAQVFGVFSLGIILLSIFVFCAETHPAFQDKLTIQNFADYHGVPVEMVEAKTRPSASTSPSSTNGTSNATTRRPSVDQTMMYKVPCKFLVYADVVCNVFFTVEFIIRLICCTDKFAFFKSFLNIVDILALLPFYIELIVHELHQEEKITRSFLDFIFMLLIMRIFRIFRLVRHYVGLRVLVYTLKSSYKELSLVVVFLGIGILIFATLAYFTDTHNEKFPSIPAGFWWAIITMTTVGYGDIVPTTALGQFIGSMCAVCGVMLIAFTVPIIVNNFVLYYTYIEQKSHRAKIKPKLKRTTTTTKRSNSIGMSSVDSAITVTEHKPNGDQRTNHVWSTNCHHC